MRHINRRTVAIMTVAASISGGLATVTSPSAAAAKARNGVCEAGEFCLYYGGNHTGSVSDFAGAVPYYGERGAPKCYKFLGAGAGKAQCIKNNASSYKNLSGKTVIVYYSSFYEGTKKHTLKPKTVGNLNLSVRKQNASHAFGTKQSPGKFLPPFPCGENWEGGTRANHSPLLAVDFNHNPDDGWKVHSSAAGKVVTVRDLGNSSYGKYVEIQHIGGWKTLYAHLKSFDVYLNQNVTEKTLIGRVGNTGKSDGSHLHYEQKINGAPKKVLFDGSEDPIYYGKKTISRSTYCP